MAPEDPPLYKNLQRSRSFGLDPEQYDRARPGYPKVVVDALVEAAPKRVLDVGCGTGQLGRLIAARGISVLGVDPDLAMAGVARRHGLEVEVCSFEDWNPQSRRFDLVVSATAWHWIDPAKGAAQAARALEPAGRFAALWNLLSLPEAVMAALRPVYQRHAPELLDNALVLGGAPKPSGDPGTDALRSTDSFVAVGRDQFPWEHTYTTASWLEELASRSSHRGLPAPVLREVLAGVGSAIDDLGGSFAVAYTTDVLWATREATDS